MVEGCSVRSICRMTDVAKGTVLKLLADLGAVCDDYQDHAIRGVHAKRVQCDEIWSFCYAKDKNVPERIASVALHFMFYNFVRVHQTLRVTPAMAAGLTDHVWEIKDLIRLLEEREAPAE